MKNLMLPLLTMSLILVVSTNTSFAQQVKDSTDSGLSLDKKAELRTAVKITPRKAYFRKKNNLKSKPIRVRAKTNVLPAKHPVEIK